MPNAPEQLSAAELVDKARVLHDTNAYKDLIPIYKALHKREPDGDWQARLADAYLQRAKQLAAKNLHKEALVLWDNMAALSDSPQAPELAVEWQLRSGQAQKAVAYFAHLTPDQPGYSALEPLLAALVLAQPQFASALPSESRVQQHLSLAQHALESYCQNGSEEQMQAALQAIPFRSPYRDLRQVLNALIKLEESHDAEATLELFERIAPDSPFAALAQAAQVVSLATADKIAAIKKLSSAQYAFAASLLGLDKSQMKLLKQYQQLGAQANDKTLLNFILNHAAAWKDKTSIQQTGLTLLAAYPQGRKAYEHIFGPVPAQEQARLAALRAERKGDVRNAEKHWIEVAEYWMAQVRLGHTDAALSAAMVLRHAADIVLQARPDYKHHPPKGMLSNLALSLKFDPNDKATYLRLAELNRASGNSKAYQRWIEQAVQHFPNDTQTLFAAASAAKARKAFKKAVGYANQLLALDPINRQAKTVLVEAHLAHARKSMLAGKPHLARKELVDAEKILPSSLVAFNFGLLAQRENQSEEAFRYFQQGFARADNKLTGVLQLWVEAERLDRPLQAFKQYAKDVSALKSDQLLAFIRQVNHYLDEEQPLRFILDELRAPLRQSAEHIRDEQTMQVVCEGWNRVPEYNLLAHYGALAQQRWPDSPLFLYYRLYGESEGDSNRLSDDDYDQLDQAAEHASRGKDIRISTRIDDFLYGGLGPGGPGPLGSPPPEVRAMLEELELLPPQQQKEAMHDLIRLLSEELGPPPPEIQQFLDGKIPENDPFAPFEPSFYDGPPRRNKRKKKSKRKRK